MMNMAPQRQLNAMCGLSWREKLPHIRAANEALREWGKIAALKRAFRARHQTESQNELCAAVIDMLDQLDRGSWKDDLGHDVRRNVAVIKLRSLVEKCRG